MTEPAKRLEELSDETREFLSNLTSDDIAAFKTWLPIFKRIAGFSWVLRWLAVAILSIAAGLVLLGESVVKILGWFKQ